MKEKDNKKKWLTPEIITEDVTTTNSGNGTGTETPTFGAGS